MKRYLDIEVWSFLRGLPLDIEISMSTEGSRIMQQVVNEWADAHGGKEALDHQYFSSMGCKV